MLSAPLGFHIESNLWQFGMVQELAAVCGLGTEVVENREMEPGGC